MRTFPDPVGTVGSRIPLGLARVLLLHGELAPRLALQTILQAGGYSVDIAGTPSEALSKLDECEYELVLSDPKLGTPNGGQDVLAYARIKDYHPATALIFSDDLDIKLPARGKHEVAIHTEDLPSLLAQVAELIGVRASRRHRTC